MRSPEGAAARKHHKKETPPPIPEEAAVDMTEHATEDEEEKGKIIEFKQPKKGPPPIPKEMPAGVPSPEELVKRAVARKAEREQALAEAKPTSKQEKELQSKLVDLEMAMDVEGDPEKKAELNRKIELMEKQKKEMISRRLDTEALRDKLGISEKGKAERAKKKAEYLGDLPGFEHLKPAEPSAEVQESMGEIRSIEAARAAKEKAAAKPKKAQGGNNLPEVSGETESKTSVPEMKQEAKVIVSDELAFTPHEKAWFQEGEKINAEHEKGPDTDLRTVPSSVEMRLDQVKDMDIPGFDYEGYSSLTRRQNSIDKMLEQDSLGEIKLGFFKKLRMKWELGGIGRALNPFQKEIDVEESARAAQADYDRMTPEQRKQWEETRRTGRRIERKRQAQRNDRGPSNPLSLKG